MNVEVPEWLEKHRLNDEIIKNAYEKTPASCRSAIKTAIALADFHFGSRSQTLKTKIAQPDAGFWSIRVREPARRAYIIFPGNYPSPARLCAAAILPVLAGVRNILAISYGCPPGDGLMLALELCGIEDVFSISPEQLRIFMGILAQHIDTIKLFDRIVSLHDNKFYESGLRDMPILDDIDYDLINPRELAKDAPFVYSEKYEPLIYVMDPESFDLDTLAFAYGARTITTSRPNTPPDAILINTGKDGGTDSLMDAIQSAFILTPGCEGFWLFPDLDKDFFTVSKHAFGIQPPTDTEKF